MIALENYLESKKVLLSFFMFALHLQVLWITLNVTNNHSAKQCFWNVQRTLIKINHV